MNEHAHCCHDEATDAGVLSVPNRRLTIALVALFALLLLSFLEPLAPLNASLLEYLGVVWWAVLLGLVVGGLIDYFVPDGVIVRLLGGGRAASLINAVLAGFLMSACSHGILAIAMQLYRKGAGVPAVIAFLLASPWANLPMTVLLFAFFGWKALLFVVGAMSVALVTGYVYVGLDRLGWIEGASTTAQADAVTWDRVTNFDAAQAVRGVAAGAISLANMVLWWIVIGIIAAALIGAYVPAHWFMEWLGPDALGMTLTLAAATVIEVCSEGTSPIALEIYNKTGVLGNPFVFLMAGVATDYTEIGLLWTTIGSHSAVRRPIVAVPQIVLLGVLFNAL